MRRLTDSIFLGGTFTVLLLLCWFVSPVLQILSQGLADAIFSVLYEVVFLPAYLIDPINRYYNPLDPRKPSKADDQFLPGSMVWAVVVDFLVYTALFYFLLYYLDKRANKDQSV